MFQEQEIFYCRSLECKHPIKIFLSIADTAENHDGHHYSSISKLRKEIQQSNSNSNFLQLDSVDEKEDLLAYIDGQVDQLKKTFSATIGNFCDYLKKFVNENLTSLKMTQLLFKAVIENNLEQITLHQDHLEFLKRDNEFFENQKEILELVREQISWTINSTSEKIAAVDKLNLPKPPLVKIYAWSKINKHTDVTVEGKIVKNVSGSHNAVLLENRLSFLKTQTIKLKIVAMNTIWLYICDLKTIKTKCPNFLNIYQNGFGAYSHRDDGKIYGTDTYGQGSTKSFKFVEGDILELQWDGPKKQFTTHIVNTGQQFVFDVKYDVNATELYFAVSFGAAGQVELM